jgi:hypothetical protein
MVENRQLYERIGYVQYDHRLVNGYPRFSSGRRSIDIATPLPVCPLAGRRIFAMFSIGERLPGGARR